MGNPDIGLGTTDPVVTNRVCVRYPNLRQLGENHIQMPKKKTTSDHEWVAAAHLDLTDAQAQHAMWRGNVDIDNVDLDIVDTDDDTDENTKTRVEVLEIYCKHCRRPFDDVADESCIVDSEGNEHLRGGPIGVRRKRNGVIQPGYTADLPDYRNPPALHQRRQRTG